jgi:hypothetical protein
MGAQRLFKKHGFATVCVAHNGIGTLGEGGGGVLIQDSCGCDHVAYTVRRRDHQPSIYPTPSIGASLPHAVPTSLS